jgi:hypothetical protein
MVTLTELYRRRWRLPENSGGRGEGHDMGNQPAAKGRYAMEWDDKRCCGLRLSPYTLVWNLGVARRKKDVDGSEP